MVKYVVPEKPESAHDETCPDDPAVSSGGPFGDWPALNDEARERLRLHEGELRDRAAALFAALSHPTRLQIVERLIEGPMSVGEVSQTLGISQSGASQHLAQLLRAGVLVAEPRSVTQRYRIRGPRIVHILNVIREFCAVHALYGGVPE